MNQIRFTIPGEPQPLRRPRVGRRGSRPILIDAPGNGINKHAIAVAAAEAMAGRPLFEGPVLLRCRFVFLRPRSHTKARQRIPFHTSKPDLDNLVKLVDGLTGVVWRDDAQIAEVQAVKLYDQHGAWSEFIIEELVP